MAGFVFWKKKKKNKVNPNSKAANQGLGSGDHIDSINGERTDGLMHNEALQLIRKANNTLHLQLTKAETKPKLVIPEIRINGPPVTGQLNAQNLSYFDSLSKLTNHEPGIYPTGPTGGGASYQSDGEMSGSTSDSQSSIIQVVEGRKQPLTKPETPPAAMDVSTSGDSGTAPVWSPFGSKSAKGYKPVSFNVSGSPTKSVTQPASGLSFPPSKVSSSPPSHNTVGQSYSSVSVSPHPHPTHPAHPVHSQSSSSSSSASSSVYASSSSKSPLTSSVTPHTTGSSPHPFSPAAVSTKPGLAPFLCKQPTYTPLPPAESPVCSAPSRTRSSLASPTLLKQTRSTPARSVSDTKRLEPPKPGIKTNALTPMEPQPRKTTTHPSPKAPTPSSSFPTKSRGMSAFLARQYADPEDETEPQTRGEVKPQPVEQARPSTPKPAMLSSSMPTFKPSPPKKFGPAPTAKSRGMALFLNMKEKHATLDEEEEEGTPKITDNGVDATGEGAPVGVSAGISPVVGRAVPIPIKNDVAVAADTKPRGDLHKLSGLGMTNGQASTTVNATVASVTDSALNKVSSQHDKPEGGFVPSAQLSSLSLLDKALEERKREREAARRGGPPPYTAPQSQTFSPAMDGRSMSAGTCTTTTSTATSLPTTTDTHSSWNGSISHFAETKSGLPQPQSATITLLQRNRERRQAQERELHEDETDNNQHVQSLLDKIEQAKLTNDRPLSCGMNGDSHLSSVDGETETSVPDNAIMVGKRETVEGDKKHYDTFYLLPDEKTVTQTETREIKAPPKLHGIGPKDAKTGIPLTLRKSVDDDSQKDWYRSMYKSLHKMEPGAKDTNPYQPTYAFPEEKSEPKREEPNPYMPSYEYPSSRFHDKENGTMTLDRYTSSSSNRDKSKNWSPPHARYRTEKYKNQPHRIEDYEPGRSSLALRESRLDDDEQSQRHNPALDKPGDHNKYVDCKTEVEFHKRDRASSPALSDITAHRAYRTVQKGGDIPTSGFGFPQPQKKGPSVLAVTLAGRCPFRCGSHCPPSAVSNRPLLTRCSIRQPTNIPASNQALNSSCQRIEDDADNKLTQSQCQKECLNVDINSNTVCLVDSAVDPACWCTHVFTCDHGYSTCTICQQSLRPGVEKYHTPDGCETTLPLGVMYNGVCDWSSRPNDAVRRHSAKKFSFSDALLSEQYTIPDAAIMSRFTSAVPEVGSGQRGVIRRPPQQYETNSNSSYNRMGNSLGEYQRPQPTTSRELSDEMKRPEVIALYNKYRPAEVDTKDNGPGFSSADVNKNTPSVAQTPGSAMSEREYRRQGPARGSDEMNDNAYRRPSAQSKHFHDSDDDGDGQYSVPVDEVPCNLTPDEKKREDYRQKVATHYQRITEDRADPERLNESLGRKSEYEAPRSHYSAYSPYQTGISPADWQAVDHQRSHSQEYYPGQGAASNISMNDRLSDSSSRDQRTQPVAKIKKRVQVRGQASSNKYSTVTNAGSEPIYHAKPEQTAGVNSSDYSNAGENMTTRHQSQHPPSHHELTTNTSLSKALLDAKYDTGLDDLPRSHPRATSECSDKSSRVDPHTYQSYTAGLLHSARKSDKFLSLQKNYSILERIATIEEDALANNEKKGQNRFNLLDPKITTLGSLSAEARADILLSKYKLESLWELKELYAELDEAQEDKEFFYDSRKIDDIQWNPVKDRGLKSKSLSTHDLRTIYEKGDNLNTQVRKHDPHHNAFPRELSFKGLYNIYHNLEKEEERQQALQDYWKQRLRRRNSDSTSLASHRSSPSLSYIQIQENNKQRALERPLHGYNIDEDHTKYEMFVEKLRSMSKSTPDLSKSGLHVRAGSYPEPVKHDPIQSKEKRSSSFKVSNFNNSEQHKPGGILTTNPAFTSSTKSHYRAIGPKEPRELEEDTVDRSYHEDGVYSYPEEDPYPSDQDSFPTDYADSAHKHSHNARPNPAKYAAPDGSQRGRKVDSHPHRSAMNQTRNIPFGEKRSGVDKTRREGEGLSLNRDSSWLGEVRGVLGASPSQSTTHSMTQNTIPQQTFEDGPSVALAPEPTHSTKLTNFRSKDDSRWRKNSKPNPGHVSNALSLFSLMQENQPKMSYPLSPSSHVSVSKADLTSTARTDAQCPGKQDIHGKEIPKEDSSIHDNYRSEAMKHGEYKGNTGQDDFQIHSLKTEASLRSASSHLGSPENESPTTLMNQDINQTSREAMTGIRLSDSSTSTPPAFYKDPLPQRMRKSVLPNAPWHSVPRQPRYHDLYEAPNTYQFTQSRKELPALGRHDLDYLSVSTGRSDDRHGMRGTQEHDESSQHRIAKESTDRDRLHLNSQEKNDRVQSTPSSPASLFRPLPQRQAATFPREDSRLPARHTSQINSQGIGSREPVKETERTEKYIHSPEVFQKATLGMVHASMDQSSHFSKMKHKSNFEDFPGTKVVTKDNNNVGDKIIQPGAHGDIGMSNHSDFNSSSQGTAFILTRKPNKPDSMNDSSILQQKQKSYSNPNLTEKHPSAFHKPFVVGSGDLVPDGNESKHQRTEEQTDGEVTSFTDAKDLFRRMEKQGAIPKVFKPPIALTKSQQYSQPDTQKTYTGGKESESLGPDKRPPEGENLYGQLRKWSAVDVSNHGYPLHTLVLPQSSMPRPDSLCSSNDTLIIKGSNVDLSIWADYTTQPSETQVKDRIQTQGRSRSESSLLAEQGHHQPRKLFARVKSAGSMAIQDEMMQHPNFKAMQKKYSSDNDEECAISSSTTFNLPRTISGDLADIRSKYDQDHALKSKEWETFDRGTPSSIDNQYKDSPVIGESAFEPLISEDLPSYSQKHAPPPYSKNKPKDVNDFSRKTFDPRAFEKMRNQKKENDFIDNIEEIGNEWEFEKHRFGSASQSSSLSNLVLFGKDAYVVSGVTSHSLNVTSPNTYVRERVMLPNYDQERSRPTSSLDTMPSEMYMSQDANPGGNDIPDLRVHDGRFHNTVVNLPRDNNVYGRDIYSFSQPIHQDRDEAARGFQDQWVPPRPSHITDDEMHQQERSYATTPTPSSSGIRYSISDAHNAAERKRREEEAARQRSLDMERLHAQQKQKAQPRKHSSSYSNGVELDRAFCDDKYWLKLAGLDDDGRPVQKSPISLTRFDDRDASSLERPVMKKQTMIRGKARAKYNFKAQNSKELSFHKGDTVYLLRQVDKNWCEGEHHGLIGIFPINYVEVLMSLDEARTAAILREGQAQAKYNFNPQTRKELALKKGEKVTLIRRVDENWYEGRTADEKQGIFPANYVEVMREPDTPMVTPASSFAPTPRTVSPGPMSPVGSIAPTIPSAPMSPRSAFNDDFDLDNFNFEVNATQLTSPSSRSQSRQEYGGGSSSLPNYHSDYSNTALSSSAPQRSMGAYGTMDTKRSTSSLGMGPTRDHYSTERPSSAVPFGMQKSTVITSASLSPSYQLASSSGGRRGAASSVGRGASQSPFGFTDSSLDTRSQEARPVVTPVRDRPLSPYMERTLGVKSPSPSYGKPKEEISKPFEGPSYPAYRSMYNYRPQNKDELELKEGDVVYVIEKCDDGWFVGTSQRTKEIGTFPGNYVHKL